MNISLKEKQPCPSYICQKAPGSSLIAIDLIQTFFFVFVFVGFIQTFNRSKRGIYIFYYEKEQIY
jgi:hypothetical protein